MHKATQLLSYICLAAVISRRKRSLDQLGKQPANVYLCSKQIARFIQGPGTQLHIKSKKYLEGEETTQLVRYQFSAWFPGQLHQLLSRPDWREWFEPSFSARQLLH